jgi:hypothetical protein
MRTSLKRFSIAVAILVLLAAGAAAWCMTHEKVIVCITNSAQQPLEDATIEINGGGTKQHVAVLSFFSGQERCIELHAKGESDATLIFSDKAGAIHRQTIIGYFEPGYRVRSIVTVGPDLQVTTRESASPTCLFRGATI